MSSTILELSELTNAGIKVNQDYQPGEFDINLKNGGITLSDGDIVNIKAGFLDTIQSGNGKIKITPEESTAFSFTYYLYNQNVRSDGKIFNSTAPVVVQSKIIEPYQDNQSYIVSDTIVQGNYPSNIVEYTSFKFTKERTGGNITNKFGGGIVVFTVTGIDGKPRDVPINVPLVDCGSAGDANHILVDGLTILGVVNTMVLKTTATRMRTKYKLRANDIVITDIPHTANDAVMVPHEFTFPFIVPPGDYLPNELATKLTDILSNINSESSAKYNNGFAAQSFLMKASTNLSVDTTNSGILVSDAPFPYLVAQDGSNVMQYCKTAAFPGTAAGVYLPGYDSSTAKTSDAIAYNVGTSELAFEYDDATNKMVIKQSHSNIYDAHADIIVEDVQKVVSDGADPASIASTQHSWSGSSGGMLFKKMEPQSVWFDKLGFDETTLLVLENTIKGSISGLGKTVARQVITNFEVGKTHTDAYVGIDAAVSKNGDYYKSQGYDVAGSGIISTINTKISALKSLNEPLVTKGFLLVSLRGLPPKRLIGNEQEMTDVTAIVSRFYTNEGYTAFSEAESIAYIHKGADHHISKLGIRILDPNHQLSQLVNSDNTIFVEVIKPNPSPLQISDI